MDSFALYKELLLSRNKQINLTAIRDPDEVEVRHFADSLEVARATVLTGKRVIDVGAGAGFPGIPLKINDPTIQLTLLEATGKKVAFLREICTALELGGVSCVQGRAEEVGQTPAFRQVFDVAVSRGVANLRVLSELCLPLVRVGGFFLAMKEHDAGLREQQEAREIISRLGGVCEEPHRYALTPDRNHVILRIRKKSPTPREYPRRWAVIQKSWESPQ